MEYCNLCGQQVEVSQGEEGTGCYIPKAFIAGFERAREDCAQRLEVCHDKYADLLAADLRSLPTPTEGEKKKP